MSGDGVLVATNEMGAVLSANGLATTVKGEERCLLKINQFQMAACWQWRWRKVGHGMSNVVSTAGVLFGATRGYPESHCSDAEVVEEKYELEGYFTLCRSRKR